MNKQIFKFIVQDRPEEVLAYIASAQDLNIQNSQGDTLLITACKFQRETIIKYLVDAGADLYLTNNKGLGPFQALMESYKNYDIAQFLANKIHFEHLIMPHCGKDSRLIEYGLAQGFDINAADSQGETLLHKICSDMDVERFDMALKMGADINSLDHFGNTPLHKYCQYRFMLSHEFSGAAHTLINDTQDIYQQNKHGFCSFYLALSNRHFEVAGDILAQGKYHPNLEVAIANIENSKSGVLDTIKTAPAFEHMKIQLFELKLDNDLETKENSKRLKI